MKIVLSILLFSFSMFTGCLSNDAEKYIKDLKSENVMVQSEAAYYLGTLKEKSVVPVLVTFLNPDKSKELRLKAIEALGKIGEKSAVDSLVKILTEGDTEMRIATVTAMGKIKDPRSIPSLIALLDDKEAQVFVIWALGNIGDKSAVSALTDRLGDPDKYVRYNAAQALKKIGSGN